MHRRDLLQPFNRKILALLSVANVLLGGISAQPVHAQNARPTITTQNADRLALLNTPAITQVARAAWLPGGTSFFVAGDFGIWQLDAAAPGKILHYFPVPNVSALAVSSDRRLLAAGIAPTDFQPGGDDEDITLIDLASDEELTGLSDNIGWIDDLAFRLNTHQLAMLGGIETNDYVIKIQDVESAQMQGVAILPFNDGLNYLVDTAPTWNQTGTLLALGGNVWNFTGEQLVKSTAVALPDVSGKFYFGSALTPDGHYLVTNHSSLGVQVWDLSSGQVVSLTAATASALAISPDSRSVAFLMSDKITLWDIASGKQRSSIPFQQRADQIRFSPDGQWLYSSAPSYYGASLWVWNMASGAAPLLVSGATIADFAFLPNSDVLTVSQIHDRRKRARKLETNPFGIIFWKSNRLGRDSLETRFIKADLRLRAITIIDLNSKGGTGDSGADAVLEAFRNGRMRLSSTIPDKTPARAWRRS